jgi:RNA-directed DNA polymerase
MERREPTENRQKPNQPRKREEFGLLAKSFVVNKKEVVEAFQAVNSNAGGAGIDAQTLKLFAQDLKGNLYKIWNRMSSGSYFPPAVKRVEIPKADGGKRPLGIPTVADRIAQTVIKRRIEPILEAIFDNDSYGYRPGRGAHDALAQARRRCWQRPWVLEIDIKGYFDSIPHDLLMKAVRHHIGCAMSCLYIQRWLEADVLHSDGRLEGRSLGTPQGGVVSPVLSNLFLHYAFDRWVRTHARSIEFERYADDIVCHCTTRAQAEGFLRKLERRMQECGLQLHPDKTRLVYCGKGGKGGKGEKPRPGCFDFLGYQFRPRTVRFSTGELVTRYLPAISPKASQRIWATLRAWRFNRKTTLSLEDLAVYWNARLRGWTQYYGKFYRCRLHNVLWRFDQQLARWWSRKRGISLRPAVAWAYVLRRDQPNLFAHWGS